MLFTGYLLSRVNNCEILAHDYMMFKVCVRLEITFENISVESKKDNVIGLVLRAVRKCSESSINDTEIFTQQVRI